MKRLTAFTIIFLLAASNLKAQLNVYYVNVGQGDSEYIELPNGKNVLIDGGPNGAMVDKFLKGKGVTNIDYVVLTHPHSDHYVGLKTVFKNYNVRNYYDSRAENVGAKGDNTLRDLAAAEPGCQTFFPEAGALLNWDPSVKVKVLSTCSQPVQLRYNDDVNNCSVVLKFEYAGQGLLFMGDAEAPVEHTIVQTFPSDLPSYALKVGHHGSRYSSSDEFLKIVQPKMAIVEVGVNNVYGHPHVESMDRLRAIGAQIFYTLGGTQTLTIPAPKRAGEVSEPLTGVYDPRHAPLPDTVREVVYTPVVAAPTSVNSPALDQLKNGSFAR